MPAFNPINNERAACKGYDVNLFVGPDSELRALKKPRELEAKRLCYICPLVIDCLNWAIDHKEIGIWGGTNEDERRAIVATQHVRYKRLTNRQKTKIAHQERALALYNSGVLIPDIAIALNVKPDTVYTYIRNQKRMVDANGSGVDGRGSR